MGLIEIIQHHAYFSLPLSPQVYRAIALLFPRLTFEEMAMAVVVFLVVPVLPGVAVAASGMMGHLCRFD